MKWQVNHRRTLGGDKVYKHNLVLDISTISIQFHRNKLIGQQQNKMWTSTLQTQYMHITTPEYQTAKPFSMKDDRMKERIKKIRLNLQC